MCLLIVRVKGSSCSPWQSASIHPGLVYLLFIPSPIPSLLKHYSFTLSPFSFFGYTLHLFYTLRNILPEAICCCLHPCVYVVLLELCYICMATSIANIWATYRHFYSDRLPEAICCCLQTCSVNVLLFVMCCSFHCH